MQWFVHYEYWYDLVRYYEINIAILKLTANPIFDFHFTTLYCLFVKLRQKSRKVKIEQPNKRIMGSSSIIIIESTKAQNAALNLKVKHKTDGESTPTLEAWLHSFL